MVSINCKRKTLVAPHTSTMTHFTLYALTGHWGPNPMKVGALLEALGLDYEIKGVDFGSDDKERGVKGADYIAICANGRAPTLIDHKNNDFTVWESGAILQYLVDKYDTEGKYTGKTLEEKAIVNQWLFFQVSGHSPVQGNLFFTKVYWKDAYGGDAPETVVKRFNTELQRVLDVYEKQLEMQEKTHDADHAWLALDRPTIADFSAYGWLFSLPMFAGQLGLDLAKFPRVSKFIERLDSLDPVKAMRKRQQS